MLNRLAPILLLLAVFVAGILVGRNMAGAPLTCPCGLFPDVPTRRPELWK